MRRVGVLCAILVCLAAQLVWAHEVTEPGQGIDETAQMWFNRGLEYAKRKEWARAIDAYLQAIRYEPRFPEAWNNLGYCYRKVKEYQKSIEAYRRALELRPDFAYAHEYIARTYLAMGNRQEAMRHYEILRRLDSKLAERLLRAIQANDPDLGDED